MLSDPIPINDSITVVYASIDAKPIDLSVAVFICIREQLAFTDCHTEHIRDAKRDSIALSVSEPHRIDV